MIQLADSGDFGVRNQQTMHAKKCDHSSHLLKQGDITEQKPKSQQETLANRGVCETRKVPARASPEAALRHLASGREDSPGSSAMTFLHQRDFELSHGLYFHGIVT